MVNMNTFTLGEKKQLRLACASAVHKTISRTVHTQIYIMALVPKTSHSRQAFAETKQILPNTTHFELQTIKTQLSSRLNTILILCFTDVDKYE